MVGNEEIFTCDGLERERPPSEWWVLSTIFCVDVKRMDIVELALWTSLELLFYRLEEMLINNFLSGNSNVEASAENSTTLESYGGKHSLN